MIGDNLMIFLDSSFILALFNENEVKNPEKAKKLLKLNPDLDKIPKAINSVVLNEVLNKLRKSYYDKKREHIITFLLNMDKLFMLMKKTTKKPLNYTKNMIMQLIIVIG